MDDLIKSLEATLWCFYHRDIGTINHVTTKERCYAMADELKNKYGVTDDDLIKMCEKAMQ